MFLLPKLKNFEAITHNARKKLEIPVEPAMSCVTRIRISTAKTPTQRVAVPEGSEGGDPKH